MNKRWNDCILINQHLESYGSGIKVSRFWGRLIIGFIAALPLGTAWMWFLLPRIKDCWLRF